MKLLDRLLPRRVVEVPILDALTQRLVDRGWSIEDIERYHMSRQYFEECTVWATADGAAIANTATETVIYPNVTIPANLMQDGRRLRLRLWGKLSTTATPTIQFTVRWGGVAGTILAQTAAITTASGVTNVIWMLDVTLQVRTNGATGTIVTFMEAVVGTNVAPTVASATGAAGDTMGSSAGQITPAAVTVDETADTALSVTAKWSAASSSNTLTGMDYSLEVMN